MARCGKLLLGILALSLFGSDPAAASWTITLSGDLGYSIGTASMQGESDALSPPVPLYGDDLDVSPLLGGAIGLESPFTEATPWQLPWDPWVADWKVRLELEAVGLRDYELLTPGLAPGLPNDDPFHTEVKTWSFLIDSWFTTPLDGLYRPIAWTAERMGQRRPGLGLRSVLRAATFYFGGGVGMASVDIHSSDGFHTAREDSYDFAWQAGTGFGYQVTKRLNLGVGYRYFDPGKAKMELVDTAEQDRGFYNVDLAIHEVRVSIRINIFDFSNPWRRGPGSWRDER